MFNASLRALRRLNRLGYGKDGSGLVLHLVYNPQGPVLPPPQADLEAAYHEHLTQYGIVFNRLYTLTNMPIARFGSMLISKGQFHGYMKLLRDNFQEANLPSVMCRTLVSMDWRGYVYDCDFNQMLGLPLGAYERPRMHLAELSGQTLAGKPITTAEHCYGCTAGQGSSCSGPLAKPE